MLNGQPHTTLITIVKITAYALIMFAQYRMIRRVILGRLKAVVLSWFGWSMLMGISVVAQRGNGKSLRQLEIIDSLMKRRTNYENR